MVPTALLPGKPDGGARKTYAGAGVVSWCVAAKVLCTRKADGKDYNVFYGGASPVIRYLKFAEGPDDTGGIISYNTQAPHVVPGVNPVLSGLTGLVISPITWT